LSLYSLTTSLLPRFELPPAALEGPQEMHFEQIVVHAQGTGLRSLLAILAAMTNDEVTAILIDEPELSLEPRLQKATRDLLVETAERKRVVLVATHSHLFLNRDEVEASQVVTREGGLTTV
jgi:predicted ATPase